MKILVTTIVSLNPGDAAILQGSLALLMEAFGPELDVVVFDKHGSVAAKYYPWAEFRTSLFAERPRNGLFKLATRLGYGHRVQRFDALRYRIACQLIRAGVYNLSRLFVTRVERVSLRHYVEADLIVASGGTYLVDHYDLLPTLRDYELTLSLNKSLVFFPQSLGPFERSETKERLREIFTASAAVFVRDDRSAGHLRAIGVPDAKVMIFPDAAFALASPQGSPPFLHSETLRVAISVRRWRHFKSGDPTRLERGYLEMIAAAVARLVRTHRASITFISTCQGIPEYWADDAETAREVVSLLEPEVASQVAIDEAFREPIDMVHALSAFDAVIATRMHIAILALSAGVPVLPIAYEFKTRELFRGIGLEEWVTDIDPPDEARFLCLLDRFLDALPQLPGTVQSGVGDLRDRLSGLPGVLRRIT